MGACPVPGASHVKYPTPYSSNGRNFSAISSLRVSDDLFALERNMYNLERRVKQAAMREEGLKRVLISFFLAGRNFYRPAGEVVITPCIKKVLVRFGRRC